MVVVLFFFFLFLFSFFFLIVSQTENVNIVENVKLDEIKIISITCPALLDLIQCRLLSRVAFLLQHWPFMLHSLVYHMVFVRQKCPQLSGCSEYFADMLDRRRWILWKTSSLLGDEAET